jgi:type VI protein secretion system component VasF
MRDEDEKVSGVERSSEDRRRLRTRNWVLFAVLLAFVVVLYFVSIVRMGANAA